VFEKEPKVSNKLVRLPNAFCVPHIGSATWASRKKMAEICLDEVVRFALGEKLHYEYRF
jgi:phosphoglycerate dehydrogenase-like enzyme